MHADINHACRSLLRIAGLEDYWSADGPTDIGLRLALGPAEDLAGPEHTLLRMAHGMWTGEGGPDFHEVLTLPEPVRAEVGRFLLTWTDTDLGWVEENTRPDHPIGHREHTPAQVFRVSALTAPKR